MTAPVRGSSRCAATVERIATGWHRCDRESGHGGDHLNLDQEEEDRGGFVWCGDHSELQRRELEEQAASGRLALQVLEGKCAALRSEFVRVQEERDEWQRRCNVSRESEDQLRREAGVADEHPDEQREQAARERFRAKELEAECAGLRSELRTARGHIDEWQRRCNVSRESEDKLRAINATLVVPGYDDAREGLIRFQTSSQVLESLRALVATGKFGRSVEVAAEELLRQKLRAVELETWPGR